MNMILGMALKILSEVEVNYMVSNQHEFNGVASLKRIFGTEKQFFDARFAYMSNAGIESAKNGSLTWYDARENHPYRTEYRLYYDSAIPLQRAKAGDTLLLTVDNYNFVNIFIVARGTQLVNYLTSQIRSRIDTDYYVSTDSRDTQVIENILNL